MRKAFWALLFMELCLGQFKCEGFLYLDYKIESEKLKCLRHEREERYIKRSLKV